MIEIQDLAFRYRGNEAYALSGVSLSIPLGALVGITGPASSGKTTLMRAINGLIPHMFAGDYAGSVKIGEPPRHGRNARAPEGGAQNGAGDAATAGGIVFDPRSASVAEIGGAVGTMLQDVDAQLIAPFVDDEILFGLENYGVPDNLIGARAEWALGVLGIASLRNCAISSLSLGQRQKVALASIIAMRPPILVLDEPTASLDPASSVAVYNLLERLAHKRKTTIVVIEQKIALLAKFADKLVVLEEGKVRFDDTPANVLEHADELLEIGVNCPRSTTLMTRLNAAGVYDGPVCCGVEGASRAINSILARQTFLVRGGVRS